VTLARIQQTNIIAQDLNDSIGLVPPDASQGSPTPDFFPANP
jgi:hypothetical protein